MEDLFIFIRNYTVLFQNALSDFLYIFSNRNLSLSEQKIALELWLVLSSFNNLLDFPFVWHVLNDVLNCFFFTLAIATRIHDIFGIEAHQLFFS